MLNSFTCDSTDLTTQQAQELASAQEQIQYLCHALEAAHQTAQYQQALIETLTSHLKTSQERVEQLERECSILASYGEESDQASQIKEIEQVEADVDSMPTNITDEQTRSSQIHSSFPQAEPIPTWSAQPTFSLDELEPNLPDFVEQLPAQELSSFPHSSNWPSPVVYPARPAKGRKSLAAIELPTFISK